MQVPCCAAATSAGVRCLGDTGRLWAYGGKVWAIEDGLHVAKRQGTDSTYSHIVAVTVSGMPSSKLSDAKCLDISSRWCCLSAAGPVQNFHVLHVLAGRVQSCQLQRRYV